MGQARQRGTYKDRKIEAIEKENKRLQARAEMERRKPLRRLGKTSLILAAVMAATGVDLEIRE